MWGSASKGWLVKAWRASVRAAIAIFQGGCTMDRIRYASIAVGLGVALGGAAYAQQGQEQQQRNQAFQSSEEGQRARQEMQQLDRDRDQRLSQQEAQSDPRLVAAWADIDVTRDGSVDATEYYLYAAQRRIGELELGAQGQSQTRSGQSSSGNQSSAAQSRGSAQSPGSAQSSSQSSTSTRQPSAGNERSDESVIAQAERGEERAGAAEPSSSDRSGASDRPSFDDADRNNDGQIDRQEYQRLLL
jgi:hypothetical protein